MLIDYIYLVLEYAEQGTLLTLINNRKGKHFTEEEVVQMFTQIALGVYHIHTNKIIHRDLKPENIMISSEGILKIGDFGMARVMTSVTV